MTYLLMFILISSEGDLSRSVAYDKFYPDVETCTEYMEKYLVELEPHLEGIDLSGYQEFYVKCTPAITEGFIETGDN